MWLYESQMSHHQLPCFRATSHPNPDSCPCVQSPSVLQGRGHTESFSFSFQVSTSRASAFLFVFFFPRLVCCVFSLAAKLSSTYGKEKKWQWQMYFSEGPVESNGMGFSCMYFGHKKRKENVPNSLSKPHRTLTTIMCKINFKKTWSSFSPSPSLKSILCFDWTFLLFEMSHKQWTYWIFIMLL